MGYHLKVITAGRAVNDYMPLHVFELLVDALNECESAVKGSKVVVFGFSHKENVGEMFYHLRRRGVKYCKDLCLKTAINSGSRPEIIKMCPVIRKCRGEGRIPLSTTWVGRYRVERTERGELEITDVNTEYIRREAGLC